MARLPRLDQPGTWHHVMNRGIARRTVFEDVRDVRYFLSRLAYAVRAGRIEVHAFCLLTTHFHLLVRSPEGLLSRAIGEAVNDYVRWFNRGRRRDGALFRGRFRSRAVESLEYRRQLVRYIDGNSVLAGLAPTPSLYPHGSARWYARRVGPPWLERRWVQSEVCTASGRSTYEPRDYATVFGEPPRPGLARVIEQRVELAGRGPDPLDDLVGAAPQRVLEWMRRKALLADGTSIDWPVCDAEDIAALVAVERDVRPTWRLQLSRVSSDGWQLIQVALLRELCGLSWSDIGARMTLSDEGASRCYRRHAQALDADADYASTTSRVAAEAIARCYRAPRATQRAIAIE